MITHDPRVFPYTVVRDPRQVLFHLYIRRENGLLTGFIGKGEKKRAESHERGMPGMLCGVSPDLNGRVPVLGRLESRIHGFPAAGGGDY